MSRSITFVDAKFRFSGLVTTEVEIGEAIIELIERAYEMGRWQGMTSEILCSANGILFVNDGVEDAYLAFPVLDYDGVIGFRDGRTSYSIRTTVSLYNGEAAGSQSFIDMGDITIDNVVYKRYRMPLCMTTLPEGLRALVKLNPPESIADSDILPIRSIAALKAGILAIAYENVNDVERAQLHWNKFIAMMESTQKQYSGNKKRYVRVNDSLRRKPSQFQ